MSAKQPSAERLSPQQFVCLHQPSSDEMFTSDQFGDFVFDRQVTSVFPDMISRSVPMYWEVNDGTARLADRYARDGEQVLDLATSLGAAIWAIYLQLNQRCRLVAMDSSSAMISTLNDNLERVRCASITPIQADMLSADLGKSDVIVLNYGLQFVPVNQRLDLLRRVYEGLNRGGVLLLAEKLKDHNQSSSQLGPDDECRLLRNWHHDFKHAMGYSRSEITHKAASIREVMQTDSLSTQRARLTAAGFVKATVWAQMYNFSALVVQRDDWTHADMAEWF